MMIVVNCRTRREGDPRVFYCGRTFAGWTGSPLGNLCSIPNKKCPICSQIHFGPGMKLLTPCRSIPCYKRWLWNEIQAGRLIDLIQSIPFDAELGCWCAPDPCHCDIVIAARRWLDQRG